MEMQYESSYSFQNGLVNLANGCAESYGFKLDESAQSLLEGIIRDGSDELGSSPDIESIKSAQTNMILFMSTMVEAAQPALSRSILDESNFKEAMFKLCPFPPFFKEPCNPPSNYFDLK